MKFRRVLLGLLFTAILIHLISFLCFAYGVLPSRIEAYNDGFYAGLSAAAGNGSEVTDAYSYLDGYIKEALQ